MASALDTLCGQAHGRKDAGGAAAALLLLLRRYLQQSLVALNAAAAALSLLFWGAAEVLEASETMMPMPMMKGVGAGAGRYLQGLVPSLFALASAQCYARFLVAQAAVAPVLAAAFAALCAHAPLCWLLVQRSRLGFLGAAAAASVSAWINALLLAAFCRRLLRRAADLPRPCSAAAAAAASSSSCSCFSSLHAQLRDLKPFLALALPSAAMSW
jgi:MATE family multidrug resistance protein